MERVANQDRNLVYQERFPIKEVRKRRLVLSFVVLQLGKNVTSPDRRFKFLFKQHAHA
jgi:hypothetical protein